MSEKEEIINYMIQEKDRYNNPIDLAMHTADMFELWERHGDVDYYPEWLDSKAEDICQDSY